MPRTVPLTDTALRSAKRSPKPYKLFDGDGLFLLVKPNGSRLWRLKYRIDGREKLLSVGIYPEVPLKTARERREAARKLVGAGIDPSAQRKAVRAARADTFEAIAREWLDLKAESLSARTQDKRLARFESFVFPYLGKKPISTVTAPDLLLAIKRVEGRGKNETAHRVRSESSAVFRYAIATGRAERDPAADLRGALAPVVVRNHAALTDPAKIGALLRAIAGYSGQPSTEYALKLLPITFVRPGELRGAQWAEFDLDGGEWRIPAERMKMREQHLVPLSLQAVQLLRELHPLTGSGIYLFPSLRTDKRPISENTLNAALRRLGYSGNEQTAHGFRSIASTLLNEQSWHPDMIELQLAHAERDAVRAAYNRAQRLAERRTMMQSWADYLDGLRAGANVTPIKRTA